MISEENHAEMYCIDSYDLVLRAHNINSAIVTDMSISQREGLQSHIIKIMCGIGDLVEIIFVKCNLL